MVVALGIVCRPLDPGGSNLTNGHATNSMITWGPRRGVTESDEPEPRGGRGIQKMSQGARQLLAVLSIAGLVLLGACASGTTNSTTSPTVSPMSASTAPEVTEPPAVRVLDVPIDQGDH